MLHSAVLSYLVHSPKPEPTINIDKSIVPLEASLKYDTKDI